MSEYSWIYNIRPIYLPLKSTVIFHGSESSENGNVCFSSTKRRQSIFRPYICKSFTITLNSRGPWTVIERSTLLSFCIISKNYKCASSKAHYYRLDTLLLFMEESAFCIHFIHPLIILSCIYFLNLTFLNFAEEEARLESGAPGPEVNPWQDLELPMQTWVIVVTCVVFFWIFLSGCLAFCCGPKFVECHLCEVPIPKRRWNKKDHWEPCARDHERFLNELPDTDYTCPT